MRFSVKKYVEGWLESGKEHRIRTKGRRIEYSRFCKDEEETFVCHCDQGLRMIVVEEDQTIN